ncbi:membrane protein [Stenotrophomonas maltophilia]|uniref:hypothetical protein n=1 Tax=Stenotrophomonas TaxID=40323 RepID=UPI0006AA41DE|nr:hypothetical protein [[Pseudomonas] hibiscicola]ALA86617.1 membrane protein [Stenotrophomonas maltophilia]ALA90573.1 membrane protein [Stenotrophomonas maltophilia]PWQ85678.1 hypothetical protein DKY64_11945 [Stenotrophomonas maltophilia]
MKFMNAARRFGASTVAKIGAGTTALVASGAALASGGASSPGAAIAGEMAGGKADIGVVIGACAVLIGLILVWAYTRKAAK